MVEFYIPKNVEDRLFSKDIAKNGCGSGWSVHLVPDDWLFFDFTIPCSIHDEMYSIGTTLSDKDEADRVFLNNMLREADDTTWIARGIARRMAYGYYKAVAKYGGPAYWAGKNEVTQVVELAKIAGKIVRKVV